MVAKSFILTNGEIAKLTGSLVTHNNRKKNFPNVLKIVNFYY